MTGSLPQNYGENLTMLASMGVEGVGAVMTVNGATDADVSRKIKTHLRKAKARTREALELALKQALMTVTVSDALSWFVHCGYAVR